MIVFKKKIQILSKELRTKVLTNNFWYLLFKVYDFACGKYFIYKFKY